MPTFPKLPTTKLVLPSTASLPEEEQAWVKVRTKILLGDIAAARELGEGDVFKTGLVMISRLITEWNYTDEAGAISPVTVETINKLEKIDYEYLDKWINDNLDSQQEGLATEEKKDSTSTLTQPSTAVSPTPAPPTTS